MALVTKGTLQSCNSAKAQGGIQAAFADDDSPELHAEDVWRSSHETADRRLVDVLTGEAQSAIHWLEELGVEFTRQNGGYRLARCGGATRQRLLQVGDRTGHAITTALRDAVESSGAETFPKSPLRALESRDGGWQARCGDLELEAADGRPRRGRTLLSGGRGARRALDQPPRRDRRGDADRARPRRRVARPRRAPVPPERRRLAAEHPGLLDPRDDARLRRGARERGRRGVHRLARPARRRLAGDLRRGRERQGRVHAGRPARGLPRHDADRAGGRRDLASVHAPPLPRRRYRSAGRADPHLPGAPLPERRARDRRRRADDARGPLRLRRDRGRHARAQPHDGEQPARVLRLRPTGRHALPRKRPARDDGARHRPLRRRRGRGRVPLRLGAQGHPAGSP